jgi:hypothetical protein
MLHPDYQEDAIVLLLCILLINRLISIIFVYKSKLSFFEDISTIEINQYTLLFFLKF